MRTVRRWVLVVATAPLLVLGCQRQTPKHSAPEQHALRPSAFLVRCDAVPSRGGLMAKLIDEAIGTDRGEVVWGSRQFGSGGTSADQTRSRTSRDYGGMFTFQRGGTERPVTAEDVDAILRALKAGVERELTASGARILDEQVATSHDLLYNFILTYDDPSTHSTGTVKVFTRLPRGTTGPDSMAVLSVSHDETTTRE